MKTGFFTFLLALIGLSHSYADVASSRHVLQSAIKSNLLKIQSKKMAQQAAPVNPGAPSYRYNPSNMQCEDAVKTEGWNMDALQDCGRFDRSTLQNQDLTGKSLKGLYFVLMSVSNVKFDSADLSGAYLYVKSLSQVSFKNANLQDATIYCDPCSGVVSYDIFQGAQINSRTNIWIDKTSSNLLKNVKYMSEATAATNSQFVWSPSFQSVSELKMIQDDVARLKINSNLKLKPVPFEVGRAFGQNSISAAYDYFYKRISYIDRYHETEEYVRAMNMTLGIFVQSRFKSFVNVINAIRTSINAWSVKLWPNAKQTSLQSQVADREDLKAGGQLLFQANFSRSLFKISQNYFEKVSWVERLSVLVHEARHSDCPVTSAQSQQIVAAEAELLRVKNAFAAVVAANQGKVLTSADVLAQQQQFNIMIADYNKAFKNYDALSKIVTDSNQCGQKHITCPKNLLDPDGKISVFAGKEASCDENIWGAYGIQAMYLKSLKDSCANCDDQTMQVLTATAAETLGRVMDRSDLNSGRQSPELRKVFVPYPESRLIREYYR